EQHPVTGAQIPGELGIRGRRAASIAAAVPPELEALTGLQGERIRPELPQTHLRPGEIHPHGERAAPAGRPPSRPSGRGRPTTPASGRPTSASTSRTIPTIRS